MATFTHVYAVLATANGTLYNVASGKRLKITAMSNNAQTTSERIGRGSVAFHNSGGSLAPTTPDNLIVVGNTSITGASSNNNTDHYLVGVLEDNN